MPRKRGDTKRRESRAEREIDMPVIEAILPADELLHELRVHQIELEMQTEELQRAQVALETSRDRYVDLYDFAPVGYLTLTERGMVAEANLTSAQLLGLQRGQLLNRSFARLVAEPDSQRWHLHFRACLQQQGCSRIDLTLKGNDTEPPLQVQLDCLRSLTDHSSPALRIVLTDITERKQKDAELSIAAAAFDTQEGIMITDAAGVILRVNRAFSDMTGYASSEAIGQTIALLHSGRHDKAFYAAIHAVVARTGTWQGEVWSRRKNNEVYPEWQAISAVVSPGGEITRYVYTMTDISQRKSWEEINHLAFHDPLTLLPNRRLLMDRLHQALATSARTRREGAIMFIDLDNLKTLNDTRGHDKGDLLLLQVAQRLSDGAREGDTVARLGGDEFVVMLADLSEDPAEATAQASTAAEKTLAALGRSYRLAGVEHHSTASIGIALFGHRQCTADELLKEADLAMYQAKTAGGNTLRFFNAKAHAVISDTTIRKADIRRSLREGRFVLYFQPQIGDHQHTTGAEALVRWQHPGRGLILPAEFIPLAEETGLIQPLGQWVLNTACAQLGKWSCEPPLAHLSLAINVSALQFHQPDFVERVVTTLEHFGVNPVKLKLELTESVMLDDVEDTIEKMATLSAHGVGLSLDDFGTGYSSLSYLKRLPLSQLKIDKSFVRDVLTNPSDAAIARTILTLGRTLGLSVIAEGVETEAQRDFLNQHGCHGFQGYLFSQPMPLKEFERTMGQVQRRPENKSVGKLN